MGKASMLSVLVALVCLPAAAFAVGPIQVIQSAPIETTLAVPGIPLTQDAWLEMVRSAQKSIDLEEFYVSNQPGSALDPILAALQDAAARGVKIRLLVDAGFYKTYSADEQKIGSLPNAELRTIDFSSLGGIQHSKYFVVDDAQAYVGSANFDWLALSHIHEVGLRVQDPAVATQVDSIFEKDWQSGSPAGQSASPMPQQVALNKDLGTDPLQLVASPSVRNPAGVGDTLTAILNLMSSAQRSIRIQVYEYTTKPYGGGSAWKVLDQAIRQAASRGVHVQLMVDQVAMKQGKKDLKALAKLKNVEVRLVTIPQWSGGPLQYARLIHSKYLVADGSAAWVGSENWSKTYFTGTRNVGFVVRDAQVVSDLNRIYDQVWNSAYVSTP